MSTSGQTERLEVLARILDMVAGSADMDEIDRYMHSDIVFHMDGLAFRGLSAWRKFMRYTHAHSGLEDTVLTIAKVEEEGERLRVSIAGQGRRAGSVVIAEPVWVTYRFAAGKVAEAWTTRRNYTFFFGERIRSPVYFVWLILRVLTWNGFREWRRRRLQPWKAAGPGSRKGSSGS